MLCYTRKVVHKHLPDVVFLVIVLSPFSLCFIIQLVIRRAQYNGRRSLLFPFSRHLCSNILVSGRTGPSLEPRPLQSAVGIHFVVYIIDTNTLSCYQLFSFRLRALEHDSSLLIWRVVHLTSRAIAVWLPQLMSHRFTPPPQLFFRGVGASAQCPNCILVQLNYRRSLANWIGDFRVASRVFQRES